MTNYNELPDIDREILRHLFQAEDHTATIDHVASQIYYPYSEVSYTAAKLHAQGIIETGPVGELLLFRPAPAMLDQLQQLRDEANEQLRVGLSNAKKQIRRFEQEDAA